MLLMTIDHTRDMFSSVSIGGHLGSDLSIGYYFTRWVTHFCAPTFVFLAGLSVALWIKNYHSGLLNAQKHVFKRGLFIVLIDISIASFLWTVIEGQHVFTIYLSELWTIGCSMILLAFVLKVPAKIITFLGIAIIVSHDAFISLFPPVSHIGNIVYGYEEFDSILGLLSIVANFPIFPWAGIAFIGYGAGFYLTHTTDSTKQQKKIFISCAVVSLLAFIFLRAFNIYGEQHLFSLEHADFMKVLYSFLDLSKYPPSLQFVLVTLIPSWIFIAFKEDFERFKSISLLRAVNRFGQTALFYYLLHLGIICIYSNIIARITGHPYKTGSLFEVYIICLIVCISAYPLLGLFNKFQAKYKARYPVLGYL